MTMIRRLFRMVAGLFKGTVHFEDKGDTAVVCVGMQGSSKYGSCPGAGADSTRMHKLLSDYGTAVLLQNKQATVSAVKAALEQACRKKLCIFFYISGVCLKILIRSELCRVNKIRYNDKIVFFCRTDYK